MTPARSDSGKYEVLIVGAGPIGMLTANLLGRRGVRTLLIDKRNGRRDWSRAIGIMPPSLATLYSAGVATEILERGVRVEEAFVHDDRGLAGRVNFRNIPSRYKMILSCPQSTTMEILDKSLSGIESVELRRGFELTGISQSGERVEADVLDIQSGVTERVCADWLVGCDGSGSRTREMANINFFSKSYNPRFVMADYEDNTGWESEAHLFFTARGSLESFPLPGGLRRWVAMIRGDYAQSDTIKYLAERIEAISGISVPSEPKSKTFEFQPERIKTARMYSRRIILAGDAAHVMSPIGGQGMNTGIADAGMLAEIIPSLLKGGPVESSLHHYDRTRRRAADIAARRAAVGMWIGTRTGATPSMIRALLLRIMLQNSRLCERLPPHFAMLTIPNQKAAVLV